MALPDVRWGRGCLAAALFLAVMAGASGQAVNYRLPGNFIPTNYKLKMVPYLEEGNMRYTGTVDITVKLAPTAGNAVTELVLHSHADLAPTVKVESFINVETKGSVLGKAKETFDPTTQFLKIPMSNPAHADAEYLLSLSFTNELRRDNYGFYLSSYKFNGKTEYMATTHFEATSARKAFPCFDEPSYRATFDISVAKLDDQIALSNMPPAGEPSAYDPAIGNRRWVTFKQTPAMPSYLVAFVVSKLKRVTTDSDKINIYVREGVEDNVREARKVAPRVLSALESFLGVSYPLPKLDMVAIPDFPAGAMENWGLFTFKEDMFLVTEDVSTADQLAESLRVITHEFVHLWFGDYVTLKWWDTIWQQEGMAALMESYMLDAATDDRFEAMSRLGTNRAMSALDVDSLEHAPALTEDVKTPEEIEDHFDVITYSKGSNIHYMLWNLLGTELYRRGLQNYLGDNKYSSTIPNDLATALQTSADSGPEWPLKGSITVKDFIDSWTLKSGYPVLTVLRDYQQNQATVSQSRFLAHEPSDSSARDSKWVIPYTLNSVYEDDDQFTNVLLDSEAEKTVNLYKYMLPANYLYVNKKQAGFYRVNYDIRNWMSLAQGASRLDAASRATLIDDLGALNRAGLVDTWIVFWHLQNTLGDTSGSGEQDMAPWITASRVIRGYSAIARGDPELSTHLHTYLSTMMKPVFENIGWTDEDDTEDNTYTRSVVREVITQLACDAGLADCKRQALKTYNEHEELSTIDPNVLAATLCQVAKSMDANGIQTLVNAVLDIEDPKARASYLRAVGCNKDSSIVQTLLGNMVKADSGLSSGEVLYLVKSIMDHSPDGCDTVLSYVSDNYKNIITDPESILLDIAKRIYNQAQLDKIVAISKIDKTNQHVQDIAAVAQTTLTWVTENLRELKQWVSAQVGVTPPRPPMLVPDNSKVPTVAPPTVEPRPTEPPKVTSEWLLPDDLEPEAYELDFAVNFGSDPVTDADNFYFTGTAVITFKVYKSTAKIVMHKHTSLAVDNDKITVVDETNNPVLLKGDPDYTEDKEFFNIYLQDPLAEGASYKVKLVFKGPLQKDLAGLYLSSYTVGSDTKYLAVTQFEQTSARKAFPCWDEPKYRATFSISITHDDTFGALSNMATTSTKKSLGAKRVKTNFLVSPRMPTYLVALLVSELQEVVVQPADPKISIWVRDGAQGDVNLAKDLAPKVLKKLQDLTGIPYPLAKLDLAAIPDFAPGAMENWGLITFKDTVLRTPKGALAHRRFNCARDITHEFSHLWFGDLVTNNWWSSLWQQEGMAAFMEAWVLDQATNYEYDAVSRQSVDRIEQGLIDDALETSGPITNHTVGSPQEIEEHAGETTYNKGAGFLRMIRAILGESTMWNGLRKYLHAHAYSTAGPDDLAAAFQEAADEANINLPVSIKDIMDSWTLKKGYPLLQVERNLHDSYLTIKQSRFLSYEPTDPKAAEEQWIVPFNCKQLYSQSQGGLAFDQFLLTDEEQMGMKLSSENGITYVICNTEQEGFYRVNYDITTWRFIGQALKSRMIQSGTQRGVLLDDALTLLRARKVDPWIVMYVLENGVPGDNSLPVWGALSKGLNYLRSALSDDPQATEDFNMFVRDLTSETFGDVDWYNYWGWEESVQKNEVRQIVSRLACDAGEFLCTTLATADNFNSNPFSHQEILGARLCTAYADATSHLPLLKALQSNDDYDQRVSIAYAMGCATDKDVRAGLVENLMDAANNVFKSNEITPFVESLLTHGGVDEGCIMVGAGVMFDMLSNSVGKDKALELLQLVSERVYSELQYEVISGYAYLNPSIQTTVAERSAANGLKFAQNELLQIKDYLAVYANRKPTAPPTLEPTDYRLPGTVVPENYNLKITPYLEQGNFYFDGSIVITAKTKADVTEVVLHSHKHLHVVLLTVTDLSTNKAIGIESTSFNQLSEMYTIALTHTVKADTEISISMEFSAPLLKDKLGFYLSDYPEGIKWKYIATTQFEQTYARKAFPCFDEPKYRATFDISIARQPSQIALSNAPVKSTSEPDENVGNRVWDTFYTTPLMPTYLVAFIVSELQKVPTSDPRINLYVRPEVVPQVSFAAEITPSILAELEKFTGVPYAMRKLDLVGIPDFYFGAMENWGLCTFRENRLLYTEGYSTKEYKIFVAEIIAHELTHLWFGDYVTLDWWSSGWLKEGMAEFLQYFILEKVMADDTEDWYPLSRLGVDDVFDGMSSDALEYTSPLTDDNVETQDEIAEHMGLYTYDKGAGLHYMLMGALGEETFKKGLNYYLNLNAYGAATPNDYADALQMAADEDFALPEDIFVIDLIHSWSAKSGLPVVTLIRNYKDNTVTASQSKYLAVSPMQESSRDGQWIVPISIYFNYNTAPEKAQVFLRDDSQTATVNLGGSYQGGTIYGNWRDQGYFHTNYDFLNWIRIGSAFGGKSVRDPMFRASTIHDAFALAKAGLVDPWMPLYLLDQDVPSEYNAAPYSAAYSGLRSYAALVKADPEADRLFQTYLHDFLGEIAYANVGWDSFRGDTDGRVARDLVTKLACSARLSDCRTRALQTYNDYLSDKSSVDPNVLAASLCEGLSHGSTLEFTAMFETLMAETERSHRMSIVYGLGCVQNSTIVDGLLKLATSMDGFEPQEVLPLVRSLLDNSEGAIDAALKYVVRNFDYMVASLGQSSAEEVVMTVAQRLYSEGHYQSISTLQRISDSGNIRDAVDLAAVNVEWTSSTLPLLKDYLAAKVGEKPAPPATPAETPIPQPSPSPVVPTPGVGPTEPPVVPDPSEWRLPSALEPLNYKLQMVPFLEVNHFEFEGKVDITILAKESTADIVMHAKDLEIPLEPVEVYDAATNKKYTVDDLSMDADKGFLKLKLSESLTAGAQYVVHLEFSAPLRTDNFGFYVSSYVINDETNYMATTHFEATSARKAFPCFDEPRFRSTFDISVARLPGQTALSNMPKIRTSDPDVAIGNRVWDDFDTTPDMPSYLVAFMVHKLSKVSTRNSNINIWVRPNAVKDTKTAVEIAPQAIQAMEDYTNFKMPLPKIDLVAIPTFPIGAMENWGLVTFREDYIINPTKATTEHAYRCSSVIQHELSHFWFGDLVTIDWWSAGWLKEGMASFLELYMLDRADESKYSAFKRILYEHVEPAMQVDARVSADVLTNYTVGSPDAISDHMGTITYSKGGSFLRMMMHFVGEGAYRRGLSDYIASNAYAWGSPEKLAAALQTAADETSSKKMRVSVQEMFNSWTLKQGYPVVTFVRDRENGIATLTQKRFLTHDPTPDYNDAATWNVPYNLWIEGEPKPTTYSDVLLESQTTKVILTDNSDYKLVLLNAEKTGFYRVNYDLLTWIYVNLRLQRLSIPSAEQRAALIDDSMALAMARQLEAWVPLSVLESGLPYETDLLPWISARNAIFRLRAILGGDSKSLALLDEFVGALVQPAYEKIDWDSRWPSLEAYNDKLLRDVVSQLACTAGSALCKRSARFDFESFYFETAAPNPDTLSATLCQGLGALEDRQFPVAWARFLAEDDPTVRSAMLYGFGCVKSYSSTRVLDAALNHAGIKSNEAKIFFNSFMVHYPDGVDRLVDHISSNYEEIKKNTGVEAVAAVLQLAAERISTKMQRYTISKLTEKDPCIEMTVVNQTANFHYRWIEEELPVVLDFLEAAAGEAPPLPPTQGPPTVPTLPPEPTPSGDFRLVSTVIPQDYKVKVVPYLSGDKQGTFEGEVTITVSTTDDVSRFYLHAAGLTFGKDDVTILDDKQTPVVPDAFSTNELHEWAMFSFWDTSLRANSIYTIKVSYSGTFSEDMKGFYLTSQDGNQGPMTVAMTKLAPTYARRVFPCFDEPDLKATFTLTVGALPSETVVSNTAVASTSQPDASIGNRVLVTFKTTPKISTHGLTVVVSPGLQSVSSADKKITLYGTDKLVANGQDTIKAAQSIIKTLESITGTPSGLDGMALIGVKDVVVEGSDNWGVDILRENALVKLDITASAGEADIYWLTSTAHRIAQHWFGNLVSMAWWDNVWLTDGFGTYFQYKAAGLTDADGSLMLYPATFASRVVSPALLADSFESAPALNNQHVIGSTAGIEKSIGDISGLKGGAIVNSLPHILGATAFESGLKNLLTTNYLGGVEPSALYAALQAGVDSDSSLPSNVDVSTVLSSWVNQPGYPVVTVIRDYDKDTATLSQERFLLHSPSGSADMDGNWYIPVSYSARYQYNKEYSTTPIKAWLEPSSTTEVPLPSKSGAQWLLVNADRKGFYRVNYDVVNWQLLALFNSEPGNHVLIEIPTRVMLLDDALSLARTGRLDYVTALQYVDYLRAEYVTHEVFATARDAFGAHLETFVLGTALEPVYKAWVGGLLAGAIKYFDYTPKPDDNSRFLVARSVVMEWACDLDLDECIKPALKDYPSWVEIINSVPHDTVGSTVCAGVRNLAAEDAPQNYERAVTNLDLEMNDVYRKAIIRGLGCVSDVSLAKSLLALTTEPNALRAGEAIEVFKSVTRFGPTTVSAALDFLSDNVIEVYKGSGMDATQSIISLVAGRVTTEAQNTKLKAVIKMWLNGSASRQISVAQLLVSDNLKWQSAHLDEVGDMLYALSGVPNPDLPAPPTTTEKPTTTTLVIPTGVSPVDPTTRAPDGSSPTWFTLPTAAPTTPVTLPPIPPTSPTGSPTSAPAQSTTTQKTSGAAGAVINVLLLAVSLLWLQGRATV